MQLLNQLYQLNRLSQNINKEGGINNKCIRPLQHPNGPCRRFELIVFDHHEVNSHVIMQSTYLLIE